MTTAPARGAMHALRGDAITFRDDPFVAGAHALRYQRDALIVVAEGRILDIGPADSLLGTLDPAVSVTRYDNSLMLPGFIDAHVHYAQLPVIGAFGRTLLDWLQHHTFPVEQHFSDPALAELTAEVFLDECLRQGITTALVYGTVHEASVDAIFAAAQARGMRLVAGKVLMDRNAPAPLLEDARAGYDATARLVARWHGKDRLQYAVTPRFAPTSTAAQLEFAGALMREHAGLYLQTHLAETRDEIGWVRELFPGCSDYLGVYERYGLAVRRSVFGHGVHLDDSAWERLHACGSAIAHCPTSNNFLGSGHFRMAEAKRPERRVHVALGTDVGAGTTLSMLATMNEAYKVARHTGYAMTAVQAVWLATAGAAHALDMDDRVGALEPGFDADIVVLDLAPTPLIAYRMRFCESIDEALGVLMMLGDDRAIRATYVAGRLAHRRQDAEAGATAGRVQVK